jgi:hypothetical protein
MADCGCLYIQWTGGDHPDSGEFQPVGLYNGSSYYEWTIVDIGTVYLWYDSGTGAWIISDTLGGGVGYASMKVDQAICPCPHECGGTWNTKETFPYDILTAQCGNRLLDCCFNVSIIIQLEGGHEQSAQFTWNITNALGFYNGYPYWSWCADNGAGYVLWAAPEGDLGCLWTLSETKCGAAPNTGTQTWQLLLNPCGCPISEIWSPKEETAASFFSTGPCEPQPCVPIEDRHARQYDSIKLPEVFIEQDRGFKICCDCPMLVLAGGGSETWKNDVTSAWIKVSDPSDSFGFILEKDGQPVTSYTPTVEEFPNEDNAYYTTIQWKDVLPLEGIGCYSLKVTYDISGVTGDFIWGQYNLQPYTIQNALETARVRVKFNLNQEIEGINFTGANVEDCIRFNGFIGDRQVNTEIDNLIYQNRTVKTVVRENLDQYIISTDPLLPCFISALTDLYLLSENEMWISDYNAHNHLYNILDIPVVVEEAPEIDYLDRWQRRAVLTCTVGLRTKNRRTYYRGN